VRQLIARSLSVVVLIASFVPTQVARAEAPTDATVPMNQLPGWVQIAPTTAPLFAADTGPAGIGVRLPKHTYLRVLGGGTRRLLVESMDESGQPRHQAWIDPDDVEPSAAADGWRVTSVSATLWQGPGGDAPASRTLDAFTPLLQVDGPVQGRIEVRIYRSDFLAVLDRGWVDLDHTGPALPPATRVIALNYDLRRTAEIPGQQQQTFLDAAAEAALASSHRTGVPASVTVAQAILESDWGRSTLARSAGNYFGMKAIGGLGNDGVVWLPTAEYTPEGERYEMLSAFRAYKSLTDSMVDHDLLLRNAARYAPAMEVAHDPRQFAHMLAKGGYATDPAYADKLIALMDRYDLYRLDS
jgi:hypothetical protein